MEAENSYGLIRIGLLIRMLSNVHGDDKGSMLIQSFAQLSEHLENGRFPVSGSGLELFRKRFEELAALEPDAVIGDDLAEGLCEIAAVFEKIVYAEASTKKIYVLPQRRFNADSLLSNPQNLLKAGSFQKLSAIAQVDFASAGRCLLFGEATAGAFHILRATEETLRLYYFHHRRSNRLTKPLWGPILSELRAKKTSKPPKVLLDSLDMVRGMYRNPTQHPDATYDIESAQDLFGVCLDLIGEMASELPKPA